MEIIDKFQAWKAIRNGRASVTYVWEVNKFLKFIQKDLEVVDIDDVIFYQAHLKKSFADNTQAIAANALRGFFTFANKRGVTKIDVSEILVPRVEEKVPVYVVQQEFELLCDIAKYEGPVMHLAIRLLWMTGVRVSELCDIQIDQVDLKEKCGTVQARKSYKPKVILWDDDTNDLMAGLISANPERKYLFSSGVGKISTRQVERWVALVVKKSGITKHITPHSFRHGATKEWLNVKVDLPAIKDLLGHRSLLSIEKYTKRLSDDIKDIGREAVRKRVGSLKVDLEKLLKS